MEIITWRDNGRDVAERQWVAEVFAGPADEDPVHTAAWYTTEAEAVRAARQWIKENQ